MERDINRGKMEFVCVSSNLGLDCSWTRMTSPPQKIVADLQRFTINFCHALFLKDIFLQLIINQLDILIHVMP